ncbi:uncharacterized protein LOC111892604 [Lactuca sativa]|uniref:uncharacterized protein LOC111892604 n=1 Tax=Lactuca sativa TaxID=4236 RepID=UPI000CC37B6A|nr:uncharacterized protein LOC111892604 [Lactuca sativa]
MEDNNGERSPVAGEDGEYKAEDVSEEVDSMVRWLFSMENDDEVNAIELSKFLEASAEKTHPMKVKIIDDPCWHPVIFQTAASYITINGNEELCGSSFSDSDTSYMAGIAGGCGFVFGDGGAWEGVGEETRGWIEAEDGSCLVNASSNGYCDDDMLAKFLGDDVGQTLCE